MGASEAAAMTSAVKKLGFAPGDLVQEFGYAEDIDFDLRDNIEDFLDEELLFEDDQEVVDSALLWWREGDGDLTDMVVDMMATLAEGGTIWILAPKPGREGHVSPLEIQEAAKTTGMTASAAVDISPDWTATALVTRKKK